MVHLFNMQNDISLRQLQWPISNDRKEWVPN